jgi:hypothetical protein
MLMTADRTAKAFTIALPFREAINLTQPWAGFRRGVLKSTERWSTFSIGFIPVDTSVMPTSPGCAPGSFARRGTRKEAWKRLSVAFPVASQTGYTFFSGARKGPPYFDSDILQITRTDAFTLGYGAEQPNEPQSGKTRDLATMLSLP